MWRRVISSRTAALVLLRANGVNVGYPQVIEATHESAPIKF
jgi:hypothetical protein